MYCSRSYLQALQEKQKARILHLYLRKLVNVLCSRLLVMQSLYLCLQRLLSVKMCLLSVLTPQGQLN